MFTSICCAVLGIFAQVQHGTFCGVERLKKDSLILIFIIWRGKIVGINLRVNNYHSSEYCIEERKKKLDSSLGEIYVTFLIIPKD